MKTVAVIQARLGSTRLPAKVLADLGGRPLLAHLVQTAKAVPEVDEVVVAHPDGDDAISQLAGRLGCRSVAGSEHDVLGRFAIAAGATAADTVIRLTADCPLLDGEILRETTNTFRAGDWDYLSVEGYPRGCADIELMTAGALGRAAALATSEWHREHIGPFFTANDAEFAVELLRATGADQRPELRACVDERADLEVVRTLHRRLGGAPPSVADIINLFDADPALAARNAGVAQLS